MSTFESKRKRLIRAFRHCKLPVWKIKRIEESESLRQLYQAFNLRSAEEEGKLEAIGLNIRKEIMDFRRNINPQRAAVIYTPMGNGRQ